MKRLSEEAIASAKDCELYYDIKSGELDCEVCSGNCRQVARKAEDERDKEWIKWGEEYCQSGSHTDNDVGNDMFPIHRRDCHYCWQELKSEEGG